MNKIFLSFCFGLCITSCKPKFNLAKELPRITKLVKHQFTNKEYLENYPNYTLDSIPKEKLYKHLDSIENYIASNLYKPSDIISQKVIIQKISNTKRIDSVYFKIINYSKTRTIKKNKSNYNLYEFTNSLDSEFIEYKDENSDTITVTQNSNVLSFWETTDKKWKHIFYNDMFNEGLFGLNSAQRIIELYFKDIFIEPINKWDKESIQIFYDAYNEDKSNYKKDGIDMDKFIKCRIKYTQKAEEKFSFEIPDKFYESSTFFDQSIKCRIYSKKTN